MDGQENSQSSEFVERVDGMKIENLKQNWDDLFDEALELHPEDKTQWSTLSKS